MTEQTNVMQDALVSIIQKTQQGIDASVSFLSEQIPDVIQQLLMWKFAQSIVLALFFLVPIIIWLYFLKPVYKIGKAEGDVGFVLFMYSLFAGLPSLIMFLVGTLVNLMQALQIYIAPKVYLIEYAASLVK